MHRLPRNVLQHISSSLEHSKIKFLNISDTLSISFWKALVKITNFSRLICIGSTVSKDNITTAEKDAVSYSKKVSSLSKYELNELG